MLCKENRARISRRHTANHLLTEYLAMTMRQQSALCATVESPSPRSHTNSYLSPQVHVQRLSMLQTEKFQANSSNAVARHGDGSSITLHNYGLNCARRHCSFRDGRQKKYLLCIISGGAPSAVNTTEHTARAHQARRNSILSAARLRDPATQRRGIRPSNKFILG